MPHLTNPVNFSQAEKAEKTVRPIHVKDAVGLDEAGRGCLAGPVVAACVCLPANAGEISEFEQVTDSKKIDERLRLKLESTIKKKAAAWALGFVWPEEIDRINILQASLKAMSKAYAAMLFRTGNKRIEIRSILLDGNRLIPLQMLQSALAVWRLDEDQILPQQTVVKGDSKILSIAAASILAKVARDRFMMAAHKKYPEYGFKRHKGYATKEHLKAIELYGTCPIHRLSFKGCKKEEKIVNAAFQPGHSSSLLLPFSTQFLHPHE